MPADCSFWRIRSRSSPRPKSWRTERWFLAPGLHALLAERLERCRLLHVFLGRRQCDVIDRVARLVALDAERPERHRDVLLADAENAADRDDRGLHGAVVVHDQIGDAADG